MVAFCCGWDRFWNPRGSKFEGNRCVGEWIKFGWGKAKNGVDHIILRGVFVSCGRRSHVPLIFTVRVLVSMVVLLKTTFRSYSLLPCISPRQPIPHQNLTSVKSGARLLHFNLPHTFPTHAGMAQAQPQPRLVDTLPSIRTTPMKVIVLGLNRTGTMCPYPHRRLPFLIAPPKKNPLTTAH